MTKKILLTAVAAAAIAVSAKAQTYAQAGESITISSLTDASSSGGVTYEWYCNGQLIGSCTEASCAIPVNMATGADVKFQRRAIAQGCAVGNTANANTVTITFCNVVVNGVCWADVHVDSWRTFASQADANTSFYQFNRTKAWDASNPANGVAIAGWPTPISENGDWHVDSSPCPAGWRLPTMAEYAALDGNSNPGGGVWAASGTRGNTMAGRFYGKKAAECSLPSNMVGCVFFPASGYRNNTAGALSDRGSYGYGWSSTQVSSTNGYYLLFNSSASYPATSYSRAVGFPVRCVR